jgi:hypothetical protein
LSIPLSIAARQAQQEDDFNGLRRRYQAKSKRIVTHNLQSFDPLDATLPAWLRAAFATIDSPAPAPSMLVPSVGAPE